MSCGSSQNIYANQVDYLSTVIPVPAAGNVISLALNIPFGATLSSISRQSSTGSGVFTVYIGGNAVTELTSLAFSTVEAETDSSAKFLAGDDIAIHVASSTGTYLNVTINYIRT